MPVTFDKREKVGPVIGVRLPKSVHDAVTYLAETEGVPHGEIIRSIVKDWVSRSLKESKAAPPSNDGPKAVAISPQVQVLWDAWVQNVGPITTNQIFHRNALSRLLKAHGNEAVLTAIKATAIAHAEQFVPGSVKASNPKQLEEKWDALGAWALGRSRQETAKPRMTPEEEAFFNPAS